MTYLLDTDHITILQQQAGPAYAALALRLSAHGPSDLALSVVGFHEQLLGCHAYIQRATTPEDVVRGYRMMARLQGTYAAAPVLPFDADAAAVFEGLQARRVRIATMDLRIASIALARGLVLITRNARDFERVPGLVIEDWSR